EPAVVTVLKGQSASFTGTLREAGLTTLTLGTDPTPLILVEVGTGPVGTDPTADATGWTMTPAKPDLTWNAAGVGDPADDRYAASLSASKIGLFDVALRVSVDGGLSWTWCDRDPKTPGNDGSEDGYQTARAGHLTVGATPCDPNPCTAPPAPTCDGDVLTTHPVPGGCAVSGSSGLCTYTESQVNCAALGGACSGGACVGTAPKPAPDEVAIVELMVDPAKVSDQSGEWIELANVSGHAVLLDGCVLEDLVGGEKHTIAPTTPLLVQPGAVALLGRSTDTLKNGGAPVQYAYGNGFLLSNTVDAVILRCDGAIVAMVEFDDDLWPFGPGVAMQLDPSAFGAPAAALPTAWCAAYQPYGAGDLGSPGAPNPPCPKADLPDWCRLQLDAPISAHAGVEVSAHGRVRKDGLTTLSGATDPNPLLLAQLGYGPQGSSPETLTASWSFLSAEPDAGWLDTDEPGVDDYVARFPAPPAGTRDVAFRFSVNGGLSWLYCDRATGAAGEDGSDNGYQTANAGALVTTAGPCDPNPCATPPAATCAGDLLTTWATPGACVVDGDAASCSYTPSERDCAAAGGACTAGACEGTASPPEIGSVVITELLRDPVAVSDALGEWVELRNVGSTTVDLWGCVFGDDGTEKHVIDPGGPLLLAPGDYLVLGESDALDLNGGVEVDYVYSGVTLTNTTADEVVLSCAGDVIDRVAWAATGWPKAAGKSMQLDPAALDAVSNDAAASWCNATSTYGKGDKGTPGSDNVSCPVDPCATVVCGATPAPDCSGGVARTYGEGGVCSAGVCQWPVASTVDCVGSGLVCLAGACVPAGAMPAMGEIVVSELMVRPLAAAGAGGQWIELTSTVDAPLLIGGCALESAGDAPWPIPAGIVLGAGQRLVIAASSDPSQNGGVAAALAHDGAIELDAEGDSVALTCGGTLIDGVGFDSLDWPWSDGRSLSLDPSAADAVTNDTPDAWCLATSSYGLGDLGSPGEANPACPAPNAVDRCRLEAPAALSLLVGESAAVRARYTEAGITDQSAGTDLDARVVVQLGRGPVASDPVVDADLWSLIDATPNPDWLDTAEPGYDEALGLLVSAEAGVWSYAFRVSVDAGRSFVWCDLAGPDPGQDGSEDGYQAALAGALTSVGDPCAPNPCVVPPPPSCQDDLLVTPTGVGVCTSDLAGASCAFDELTTDCAALGGTCDSGACEGVSTVPGPGHVVFTEIMNDPVLTTDPNGEWLELTVVGPNPVELSGCILQSDGDSDRVISAGVSLVVVPGLHVVFARKADPAVNGGVAPTWSWLTGLTLGNGADAVRLLCGGQLIDAVAWDGGPAFPAIPGASMQLSASATDANAAATNDLGASWCASKLGYGLGDLGSPGAPNAGCP
ncbi:MAG: lamin tail domain-containing protein, partial [Myxococcota bacterium]